VRRVTGRCRCPASRTREHNIGPISIKHAVPHGGVALRRLIIGQSPLSMVALVAIARARTGLSSARLQRSEGGPGCADVGDVRSEPELPWLRRPDDWR
jgi:hypothetical protein